MRGRKSLRADLAISRRQTRWSDVVIILDMRRSRSCRFIPVYRRAINSQFSVLNPTGPRTRCCPDGNRTNWRMSKFFHILWLRAAYIAASPNCRDIIDNGYPIYDRDTIDVRYIVIANPGACDVAMRDKGPAIDRRTVINSKADPRPNGRPAIIVTIFTPGHPGRRPVIIRKPHPAIVLIIKPVAIVKWRPSPGIV